MRDILAIATGYESWNGGMAYAAGLAGWLAGTLTGVFVQPSPYIMVAELPSSDLLQAMIDNAREVEEKAYAAKDRFIAWARAAGAPQVGWQVAEGHLPDVVARLGNWHDLLVLERDSRAPWGAPPELGLLVLRTHMPCIVVPRRWRVARADTIALAWNGSAESLRAMHAALPLLHKARRVVLLDGGSGDPLIETGWNPRFDVQDYLLRHAIASERQAVETDERHAGDALLDRALAAQADLLVMGAYGRPRVSEWAFGGATRKVLADATMPVLLHH